MDINKMLPITAVDIPRSMWICVALWLTMYTISYLQNNATNKDHFNIPFISNIHTLIGLILAVRSICTDQNDFDDNAITPEMTLISWSTGYFAADFIDCVVRKDKIFIGHAIVGMSLIRSVSISPFYELKAGSYGFVVEFSNIWFNYWKKTKTKRDFRNFLLSFFLVRIVYTPIFLRWMNGDGRIGDEKGNILGNRLTLIGSLSFYLLNSVWFYKGCQMYLNYDENKVEKKES
mmetsp:Transcript_1626/g.1822  ORF Transcript_1626/g.1822 Transcript_1626/m.1822 type:complete len:233 (+) Transcript_1626:101-799(+)